MSVPIGLGRMQVAWRTAQDIPEGAYVNLGIGVPELVAGFVPDGREVVYHSENGILGFGPTPPADEIDWDLVNAGKKPVSLAPGASLFHHADSFAMIRGGHIDIAILGAFEVAGNGDLANWSTGGNAVPAVGGAMDLVAGAKNVFVVTDHTTKSGEPKLVRQCSMPLTGAGVVTRVFTNFGVFGFADGAFVLQEIAPDLTVDDVLRHTDGPVQVSPTLTVIRPPPL